MTAPRMVLRPVPDAAPRVERAPRRRGAFGLDERRFPDPARVEAELRGFLAGWLPEVWPVPSAPDPTHPTHPPHARDRSALSAPPLEAAAGRTLTLLLPRGHVALLRIARDLARPDPESVALADRCRAMGIPHATVSTLAEGRAALRRLGVEPRPAAPADGHAVSRHAAGRRASRPALEAVFGRG